MIDNTYLVPAFLSAAAFSVQAYPLNLSLGIPLQSKNYIKLKKNIFNLKKIIFIVM